MEIRTTTRSRRDGLPAEVVYRDISDLSEIADKNIEGQRAFCFYKDKLVIVHEKDGSWNLPGGGVEENEPLNVSIIREVAEETNMKVLQQHCLGVVDVHWTTGTRSYAFFACIVEPIGAFVSDPAEEVTEILLIDPAELQAYDHYFDEVKKYALSRALELKKLLTNS